MFKKLIASRLVCYSDPNSTQSHKVKETASFIWGADWLRRTEPALAESEKCTLRDLMVRVGHTLYNGIRARYPDTRHWLILVGTGNNGGDALEVARRAVSDGIKVDVFTMPASKPRPIESQIAMAEWRAVQGTCHDIMKNERLLPLVTPTEKKYTKSTINNNSNNNNNISNNVDLIIDGLLGTGITGAPRPDYVDVIEQVNAFRGAPVVAIDIPSGLNAETGEITHNACINADYTMTFITLKPGLFLGKGQNVVGTLEYDDLNLTQEIMSKYQADALIRRLTAMDLPVYFNNARPRCSHKGSNGKVVLVGGDCGMGGAIIMASEAAVSVGAGLTKVCTRSEYVQPLLSRCPEAMVNVAAWDYALDRLHEDKNTALFNNNNNNNNNNSTVEQKNTTTTTSDSDSNKEELLTMLEQGKYYNTDEPNSKWNVSIEKFVKQLTMLFEWADVIAVGPGLGTGLFGHLVVNCALEVAARSANNNDNVVNNNTATSSLPKTLVMDADALRILQFQRTTWRSTLPLLTQSVITPHPGEAAFLLGCSVAEIESDRLSAARRLSAILGGVCVLKGAGTIVYQHHGNDDMECEANYCSYVDAGNPGMGCGGMGDVLTGTIAGIAAQSFTCINKKSTFFDKVCAATLTHSVSADLVISEVANRGTRGLRPTELIPYLQKCVNCTWKDF